MRVSRTINVREDNGLSPAIHGPLDQRRIVGGYSHGTDGFCPIKGSGINGSKLSSNILGIAWAVLAVDDQPIKAAMSNQLGDRRASERQPAANGWFSAF
ncbi:hypothetical protein D3C84_835740 [compost metagenome]